PPSVELLVVADLVRRRRFLGRLGRRNDGRGRLGGRPGLAHGHARHDEEESDPGDQHRDERLPASRDCLHEPPPAGPESIRRASGKPRFCRAKTPTGESTQPWRHRATHLDSLRYDEKPRPGGLSVDERTTLEHGGYGAGDDAPR